MFPGRLHITYGDSRKTIQQFHQQNPEITCDLIVIDGGHDQGVPYSDFICLREMVNISADHLLVVDDCPSNRDQGYPGGVQSMWDNVTMTGQATGQLDNRGLTLGTYLNNYQ